MPLSAPTSPDVATPAQIDWKHGGIEESWDDSGPKATVVYRCLWVDRYDLVADLMGGYQPGAGGFGAFNPPHAYPPSPNLVCRSIGSIKGLGAKKQGTGSRWLPYKYAVVVANYALPSFDVSFPTEAGQIDQANPILYCKQSIRTSSAFEVVQGRPLKFSVSGKIVESEVARPAAQTEITLEFPRVPFNPYLLCLPYIGKVNQVRIFHHDPGLLLFDGVDTNISGTADGLDVSTVLTFLGRSDSWNSLINEEGEHELIEYDGVVPTRRLIDEADFFDLLA